jgi:DNA-binding MarR family transcriptional regulator/GNAT superfamily N-acetyltransferase
MVNAMAELDAVATVRRFNRFYTRAIGVLDRGFLDSPYTLTETRVLYEIAHGAPIAPKTIAQALSLDPGYLSRMVARFEREGLVGRERSFEDRRSLALRLTPVGRARFAELDLKQAAQVETLIQPLSERGKSKLVDALSEAQRLLSPDRAESEAVLRGHQPGDMGWVTERHAVLYGREYGWTKMEAMVGRITADFLDGFDPHRERCWIAERDGERLGSVFLVNAGDGVGQLRLLLLEPQARGQGLGRRLVEACIEFARLAGYREMTLWTHEVLTAARAIYAGAGFKLEDRWTHEDFGPAAVSETWRLSLP